MFLPWRSSGCFVPALAGIFVASVARAGFEGRQPPCPEAERLLRPGHYVSAELRSVPTHEFFTFVDTPAVLREKLQFSWRNYLLSGAVPVAPNLALEASANDHTQISFTTGRISAQPKPVRKLFEKVREESRLPDGRTREFGAMALERADGFVNGKGFTSDHPSEIRRTDMDDAYRRLVDDFLYTNWQIRHMLHIHSHPDPATLANERWAYRPEVRVAPSLSDYEILSIFEKRLALRNTVLAAERGEEPLAPVVDGVILPDCPGCEDTFLLYRASGVRRITPVPELKPAP